MKLATIRTYKDHQPKGALLINNRFYPLTDLHPCLPASVLELIQKGPRAWQLAREIEESIKSGKTQAPSYSPQQVELLAPIPEPPSFRDAYAFRQHVEAARRSRGAPMIAEFDLFPVFYFTNHQQLVGAGEVRVMPDHLVELDYELEVAIVIGKEGRNIRAEEADDYIFGFTIMNDFSARHLQREEMKLSLGPAKGKDFATAIGPVIITKDEVENRRTPPKPPHRGNSWDMPMRAYLNNEKLSEGNLKDMDWTFHEIIERVSYGVTIRPGELIGSGTVGTGCLLELNGTARLTNPNHQDRWLQPGDTIVLEVEPIGKLENTIVVENTTWSILKLVERYATARQTPQHSP